VQGWKRGEKDTKEGEEASTYLIGRGADRSFWKVHGTSGEKKGCGKETSPD